MIRLIIIAVCMFVWECQAQHPYFDIPVDKIEQVARADGYRPVASIEGDSVPFVFINRYCYISV